jgi:hypothetical protein
MSIGCLSECLGANAEPFLATEKARLRALCGTAICPPEMSLWVISVTLGDLADVRFTPESDRLLRRRKMTLCAH